MRRFLPHLIAGGTAVALFAGGVYLGDSRESDPTPSLAVGEPVTFAPVRSEPPIALDEDGYPVDDGSSSGGGSGAGAEDGSADGSGTSAEEPPPSPFQLVPGRSGSAPSTADDGRTGDDGEGAAEDEGGALPPLTPVDGPEGLAPGSSDEEPHIRFTDPCAGALPGAGGGEDCPEGVGGAILMNDDLPAAPPLTIDDPWMGPIYVGGAEARCPHGVDPDGTVHAFVLTNVPATLTLTLEVRGERHVVTAETSPEERLRFTGRLLDGELIDGSQINGVQTCVTFESLPRSLETDNITGTISWYKPAVTGVDDQGNEIDHPAGFLQMRIRDDEGYLDEFADDVVRTGGPTTEPEFAAGGVHFGRWGAASARCRRLGPYQGALYGTFTTSVPGTFDLAVIDRGRRIEIGRWTTPSSEIRLHDELMASGETPSALGPTAVQTCFNMRGVDNPGRYYLDISGVTEGGETASARLPFTITEALADQLPSQTAGRPRTIAQRSGEQVNVLVSYDSDDETVIARSLPRNGPYATGDDCTTIEESALRNPSSDRYLDLSSPSVPRFSFDPFGGWTGDDDRFDRIQPIRVTPGEGGVLDVCIWIYTKPRGDFDPTVEQREQLHIESPRNLRIALGLSYIHASSSNLFGPDSLLPIEARRYRVTALNWPGQPSATFPSSDVPGSERWDPAVTILHSGANRIPDTTHLRIEDNEHGHVVETMVPTPNSCLLGRPPGVGGPVCSYGTPQRLYVDLPDNEGTWCITDCHGRRFIQLTVTPEEGPGGPPGPRPRAEGEGWVIRNEGSFDRTTLELPVKPRADLTINTPTVEPGAPGERPKVKLVLPFDRPVDVTVVPVLHEPIPETCDMPVEQTSPAATARHTFFFADMCFGAHYTFDVHAVDPVGGGRLDLPGVVFTAITPGYPISSISVDLVMSGSAPMHRQAHWTTIRVGDNELINEGASSTSRCLEPAEAIEQSGELRGVRGRPVALGDHNNISIQIQWKTCDGGMRRIDGGRPISIADLLAGPVTYAGVNDDITFEMTIRATPTPGYPAP